MANIDTRTEGRLDTPKRAATGAQQFMKGVNKSIREAREKLKGIADNEFIADINVLIADVKNTKDLDSAQTIADIENRFWKDILDHLSTCRKLIENASMNIATELKSMNNEKFLDNINKKML